MEVIKIRNEVWGQEDGTTLIYNLEMLDEIEKICNHFNDRNVESWVDFEIDNDTNNLEVRKFKYEDDYDHYDLYLPNEPFTCDECKQTLDWINFKRYNENSNPYNRFECIECYNIKEKN